MIIASRNGRTIYNAQKQASFRALPASFSVYLVGKKEDVNASDPRGWKPKMNAIVNAIQYIFDE